MAKKSNSRKDNKNRKRRPQNWKEAPIFTPIDRVLALINDNLKYALDASEAKQLSRTKAKAIVHDCLSIKRNICIEIPKLKKEQKAINIQIAYTKRQLDALKDNEALKHFHHKWDKRISKAFPSYLRYREETFQDSLSDADRLEYTADKKAVAFIRYQIEGKQATLRDLYDHLNKVEESIGTYYLANEQYLTDIRAVKGKEKEIISPVVKDLETSKKQLARVECSIANHPFAGKYKRVERSQKAYNKLSDLEVKQYFDLKSLLKERDKLITEVAILEKKAREKARPKEVVNGRTPFQQIMDSFISLEKEYREARKEYNDFISKNGVHGGNEEYIQAYRKYNGILKEYTDLLTAFAVAIVISVLNKLKNAGSGLSEHEKALKDKIEGNKGKKGGSKKKAPDKEYWGKKRRQPTGVEVARKIRELMKEVNEGRNNLDNLEFWEAFSRTIYYDKKGRCKAKFENKDVEHAIQSLMNFSLGDGWDLVSNARELILLEIKKYREREGAEAPINFEKEYTFKAYKSHVLIKSGDAQKVDVISCPVKEVFRQVRRLVSSEKGLRIEPKNGYLYLPKEVRDNEGLDEVLYIRAGKYSDFASENEYNLICSDVDTETYINLGQLVDSWGLTDTQKLYFGYRMQGYGYKAIATMKHISHNAVINVMKGIQKKAIASGLLERQEMKEALINLRLKESTESLLFDRYSYDLYNGKVKSEGFYRWIKKKEYRRLFNQLDYRDFVSGTLKLVEVPEGLSPAVNRESTRKEINWEAYRRKVQIEKLSTLIEMLISDYYEQKAIRATWKRGRVEIPRSVKPIVKKEVKEHKKPVEVSEKEKLEKELDKIEAMLREGEVIAF